MAHLHKVLIVGGGSSGWMTAALLRQRLPEATEITLVEASDVPIIGVGESTNPIMFRFQSQLGLDEKSFMRASNAAYKLTIRFRNFDRQGGVFHHPFGLSRGTDAALFKPGAERHYPNYHAATRDNRFSKRLTYAYQLDAGLYGQYLKLHCVKRGVRHVVDNIGPIERDDRGDVARIQTQRSGPLTADLYVDCTGFRSLLLGKALCEPFHSVNRFLLNDRAIAARVPYLDQDAELRTYTDCTALSAGWVWNIPLWSRIGTGYVYSSQFLSAAQAEAEYRAHLGVERVRDLAFNHIEIRAGRHERAWVGNCVAIGISFGFLEPLESTGLSLTQVSIMDLATALRAGADSSVERELFNRRQRELFDHTRDFVMAHYVLTARDDTPYWRHIRQDNPLPDSLVELLGGARLRRYDALERQANVLYTKPNWNAILSGMGFFDGADDAQDAPAVQDPDGEVHARLLARDVYDGEYEEPAPRPAPPLQDAHPMWSPTW